MMLFFFFFQAEDGIRDADVTGVQTCALPICRSSLLWRPSSATNRSAPLTLVREPGFELQIESMSLTSRLVIALSRQSPQLRHRRNPGRDDAGSVAVPRKPLRQPPVPAERVWVQIVRLCLARPEFPGRVGEVDDRLALDLPLVAAEAPVAEVERLVHEHERAERPLPGGNVVVSDVQGACADERWKDRVVGANVRVPPAETRMTVRLPLRRRGAL